jgi:hypothetical protein
VEAFEEEKGFFELTSLRTQFLRKDKWYIVGL